MIIIMNSGWIILVIDDSLFTNIKKIAIQVEILTGSHSSEPKRSRLLLTKLPGGLLGEKATSFFKASVKPICGDIFIYLYILIICIYIYTHTNKYHIVNMNYLYIYIIKYANIWLYISLYGTISLL